MKFDPLFATNEELVAEYERIREENRKLRVACNPTREALADVGVPFPPPKGWRKRLLTPK